MSIIKISEKALNESQFYWSMFLLGVDFCMHGYNLKLDKISFGKQYFSCTDSNDQKSMFENL